MTKLAWIDEGTVRKAYARWEPVYDLVFGELLAPGRRQAIELINQRSGSVLEVGVGTGISLPQYRRDLRITGIDLSPEMLAKARERVERHGLDNVEALLEMDAANMSLAAASFDVVVAMYVLTAVPDPAAVMRECERVCRPGGEVLVLNHFSDGQGVRGFIEKVSAPAAALIGWRPEFPRDAIMVCDRLELKEAQPINPFGIMQLLRFVKKGER
jgi:phosphatidylethanolamine/phosphatidyl-N-methylethanolamine N-methyltransferase